MSGGDSFIQRRRKRRELKRQRALAHLHDLKHQGDQTHTHRSTAFLRAIPIPRLARRHASYSATAAKEDDFTITIRKGIRIAKALIAFGFITVFLYAIVLAYDSHVNSVSQW